MWAGRIERLLEPVRAVERATGGRARRPRGPGSGISISRSALTSWRMSAIGNSGARSAGPMRLVRPRVERRRRRHRQVGRDVVPGPRDPVLVEDELRPAGVGDGHRAAPPVTGGGTRSLRRRGRAINPPARGADGLDPAARGAAARRRGWLRNRTTRSALERRRPAVGRGLERLGGQRRRRGCRRASVRATVRCGRNGRSSVGQPSARERRRRAPSTSDPSSAAPCVDAQPQRRGSCARARGTSPRRRAAPRRPASPPTRLVTAVDDCRDAASGGVSPRKRSVTWSVSRWTQRGVAGRTGRARTGSIRARHAVARLRRDGAPRRTGGASASAHPARALQRSRSSSRTSRARSWSRQPTTSTVLLLEQLVRV